MLCVYLSMKMCGQVVILWMEFVSKGLGEGDTWTVTWNLSKGVSSDRANVVDVATYS